MKLYNYLFSFLILTPLFGHSQTPTIGLTYYSDSVSEGYTLFSPDLNNHVYLINNCGERVNEWIFNEAPGISSYLLPNGNLLCAGKDSLTIRDWSDNTVWSYATTDNGIKQHHDIEPLPNGNILCIVTQNLTTTEQTDAGKDSSLVGGNFRLDKIVELQPVGTNDAIVVWEWRFFDHLVQDYDNSKNNYGIVENHPELIDFNFDHGNINDWTHLNSVDYNADLDQIMISSRHMSELYIIDHSTTTLEAAGHTGGSAGMGGDILWRWGNPRVYRQGTAVDQKLFGQHDGKWVENGFAHEGKISVFNNDADGTMNFSSVHVLQPNLSGFNYLLSNSTFDPVNFSDTWNGDNVSPVIYSSKKCSVQSLENGGYLVNDSGSGRFVEVNANHDVVWSYTNPHGNGAVSNQFDVISGGFNGAFRVHKYAPDYPGIAIQTLTTIGIIEDVNSLSLACSTLDIEEDIIVTDHLITNPIINGVIEFINPPIEGTITLINMQGQEVQNWEIEGGTSYHLERCAPGSYILQMNSSDGMSIHRLVVAPY